MIPDDSIKRLIYKRMVTIRKFEEKAIELMNQGKLVGEVHPYIGEEASAVGVCAALNDHDYITSTHRGHGHVIAKGADVKGMMAELMGRKTGLCKGKGGSMHIADVGLGILGANGIVGGGLPIATGAGLAAQVLNDHRVAVCFFGDGASNEGAFHESLNLSTVWKLPVIFVCEDNKYHEFSASGPLIAGSIVGRAAAYQIPGIEVDGQNVLEVYNAAMTAVARARNREGPSLLVTNTYRYLAHFIGEESLIPQYRSQDEVAEWRKRDPIDIYRSWLCSENYIRIDDLDSLDLEIQAQIDESVIYAESSLLPSPEEALEDLFVESKVR